MGNVPSGSADLRVVGEIEVDEDGFFALVNTSIYEGFVNEDWSLSQLLEHFAAARQLGSAFVVYVGPEADGAQVTIRVGHPEHVPDDGASARINATDGVLYVPSFTDLTMAAQFADSVVVEHPDRTAQIHVPSGTYEVLAWRAGESLHVSLELLVGEQSLEAPTDQWDRTIAWFPAEERGIGLI
ncbi:hypothetical protein [Rhodococcus sp. 24CO]|uniref:hypothetical protein n=1 Tax=Rhodococcus sp. 24CO TaxID=3117460 RepID=UPI003D339349